MTKRRKDTDYLFLSARIRSLEKNLLTAQRLEQLLQAPSAESCSQLLADLGYDPIRDEATLQESLKKQREAVFAELERFMPEKELLDVFRIKYDYHNIKVLLKAPEGAERLLMDAGTIRPGSCSAGTPTAGTGSSCPGIWRQPRKRLPSCWRRPAAPSAATAYWIVPASTGCGSWRQTAAATTSRATSAP